MSNVDRGRLVFAVIFTVVALPALWVMGRDQAPSSTAPTAGAAGLAVPSGETGATVPTTYTPAPPVFLDNARPAATRSPAQIDKEIARGTVPPGNYADVRASFRRYPDPNGSPCTTPLAPGGRTITVLNLDNGQSTTCHNKLGVTLAAGIGIVVHTDVLAKIANLSDAPVNVRISW
ncbi:MAG: hypothetical protein ABIQ39_14925 [Ilumatobacteraceae bacterium]